MWYDKKWHIVYIYDIIYNMLIHYFLEISKKAKFPSLLPFFNRVRPCFSPGHGVFDTGGRGSTNADSTAVIKWDPTMQMYGNFEGSPWRKPVFLVHCLGFSVIFLSPTRIYPNGTWKCQPLEKEKERPKPPVVLVPCSTSGVETFHGFFQNYIDW